MLKKTLLPLAAAVMLAQGAQASNFSDTLFFGDSLTDSGSFGFQFTTNPGPVWAQNIADNYGVDLLPANQGGTNYAEGGARLTGLPGIGAGPALTATPVLQQVQSYLASTGGKADPNALYALWAGANDIFWLAGGNEADIPAYVRKTIGEHVTAIGMLRAAGAQYVVVPLLPDIGQTPFGMAQGPEGAAGLTQLTQGYNNNLMLALQVQGISVIPADVFSLLHEAQADPAAYGFDNVSVPVCGATPSPMCMTGVNFPAGLENTFLFADGVHPTTGGHKAVSDYVQSLLDAPAFTAQAGVVALQEQRAVSMELDQQSRSALYSDGAESRFWASGSAGDQSRNSAQGAGGSPYRVGVGIDKRVSDDAVLGFALHQSWNAASLSSGRAKHESTGLSVYGARSVNNWLFNGSISVAKGSYDLTREVNIGPATRRMTASTDGFQLGAQVAAQYRFEADRITHGPLFGLRFQQLSMDSYTEQSPAGSSTALHVDPDSQRETSGFVGWHASADYGSARPYASLVLESRLNTQDSAATVALVNVPGQRFSTPAGKPDKHYAALTLGSDFALSESVRLGVSLNHLFDNADLDETRVSLSASLSF
ncbi:autotransporter domain-containing protein [Nitrincola sp. MINF-07-Sa-05]|uniref:autotransporter domain-containing protein n=1 Tax=Nitrincola salilacus TaxID=3400273 RepID=UPI0039183D6E